MTRPLAQEDTAIPYIDGRRVSNEEWTAKQGDLTTLHTSERGVNPGEEGVVLADANADTSAADKGEGDKVVYGTHVLDVPADNEADSESVASSELSGDIPGDGSGDNREESSDSKDEEAAPATASEATADFVAKRKSRASKADKA